MPDELLVFDLETKFLAEEVGGWSNIAQMGLAVGVLLEIASERMDVYFETDADTLIKRLADARKIIGFNLVRFDYNVLKPYGLELNTALRSKSIDILQDIYHALGFRISLDNLVRATLGEGKLADGRQSVEWYREGNIEAVIEYCKMDVRQTWKLFLFGLEKGYLLFRDRSGAIRKIPVRWKLEP
jgi:DEAD/DEAH box helicase domain-containing protein